MEYELVLLLKDFLRDQKIRLRKPGNELATINFLYTDLTAFGADGISPLALGLVYIKPDNTATQDFHISTFNSEGLEHIQTDRELEERYPKLNGGHKKKFSITDFQ